MINIEFRSKPCATKAWMAIKLFLESGDVEEGQSGGFIEAMEDLAKGLDGQQEMELVDEEYTNI